MSDLEFSSPFEPTDDLNPEILLDQTKIDGRELLVTSYKSSNGDLNALKFAARDLRGSLSVRGDNTDELINFLSKEIGDQGLDSQLNNDQLQDALKDLQFDNSINYNFNNDNTAEKEPKRIQPDLCASNSNTLTKSAHNEPINNNTSVPNITEVTQSPFEMMSPFEPSDLPDAVKPQKKFSFGDAPYSLDDFIDSSPFEPTPYNEQTSLTTPISISEDVKSDMSSAGSSFGSTKSPAGSYSTPPSLSTNYFANAQPSSSPPISVITATPSTRKFSVLKQMAPLSSSPPIAVMASPLSAPTSPRTDGQSETNDLKAAVRSNSLNSTYGSTPVNSIPKKESSSSLAPVHEREELMETIIVDQNSNRKSMWVVHKPVTNNYQLGSHRKSTAVNAETVAQLNAYTNQPRLQSVKFSEPLKDNSEKNNKWQAIAKVDSPKIGKENLRTQRKSVLTRSTSASSLQKNSVSKENSPSNSNAASPNMLRKNSKTEPTSPLTLSKSETSLTEPLSGGIVSALAEASLVNENNNTNEEKEKKPRRKSLLGKLTRTLSTTFKPLSANKDKESNSPLASANSSTNSSPSSTVKISPTATNEKRKKRSQSDARREKKALPVPNDRDRSQTVVTFNDMMQRNLENGPYSANGIFGVPLDILFQQNDGVPEILNVCCGYLVEKAINLEGLFRISPNMNEVNQWKTDLTFESMHKLNDIDNPHLVASLLVPKKQFFLDMPDPLFTDELFKQFQDSTDIENDSARKNKLEELLEKLPEANLTVLKTFISFLRKVAQYSHENKMDAKNLGLVLSPCLLRRKHQGLFDVSDLTKAKQHWMIIHDLIVNYDLIGDAPPKDYLPQ